MYLEVFIICLLWKSDWKSVLDFEMDQISAQYRLIGKQISHSVVQIN